MASFAGGKVEGYVGPQELGASDNLEEVIVSFIDGAKKTLHIAVQEVDSLPIAQAILDASWRGVAVRMVLEQDYLEEEKLPPAKKKSGETSQQARHRAQWSQNPPRGLDMNRDILSALLRSSIHVTADYNPKIFHQKFIIRDYPGRALPTSAMLTGSANFTHTDTHTNLNHLVVFNDSRICREYFQEFEQIQRGSFGRGNHGDVPQAINLGGVPVKILFAPDHTPELEIMKQMLKAKKLVRFAIFTFAGSSGIDDAAIMLKRAGIDIYGALDPGQAVQKWAATEWMHQAGVGIFLPKRVAPFRKLHHKLMVIDKEIVVAGSFNYTAPANEYNDENIFVIGSPYKDLPEKEGGPVDLKECRKIAGFFGKEVDRIVKNSEKYS